MNKTVLVVGGVVIVGALVYLFISNQNASAQALNEPGLSSGATSPLGTLSSLMSGGGSLGSLTDAFSGGGDSNDPGLGDNFDSSYGD